MRKISKIAIVVLVVAALLVYIGNTRKGSRTWIENKVSDIERVYPTENLEDLLTFLIHVGCISDFSCKYIYKKEQLLEAIVSYQDAYPFAGVIPISAKNKDNLEELLNVLSTNLPEGPQYFPEDMITDQPERLIISDIVREKILLSTRDEIPHAIAVDVDEMKTRDDGTTYIRATIYCERDSQKGIIIGKKGALLKQLGAEARADIQKLLATKVYLDLWVKVKKDWRNKSGMLSELGYK